MTGKPVSWYSDVFDIIFSGLDKVKAKNLWKDQLKKADKKGRKTRVVDDHEGFEEEDNEDDGEVNENKIRG